MDKKIIKNIQAKTNLQNKNQIIPYNIFQTFKYRNVPISMYKNAIIWNKLNPEYNYYFYDDNDLID